MQIAPTFIIESSPLENNDRQLLRKYISIYESCNEKCLIYFIAFLIDHSYCALALGLYDYMKNFGRQLTCFSNYCMLVILFSSCRDRSVIDPTEQSTVQTPSLQSASYVGHKKCAECHSDIAEKHLSSPHAHTFALTKDSEIAALMCGMTVAASAPYDEYKYACDAEGLTAAMPEKFRDLFPLDFALGSGKHAVTFLTLMQDASRNPVGIEHRKTWFSSDQQLGLTPGQEDQVPTVEGEYFGRIFIGNDLHQCIDCHTTTAKIVGRELENLYPNVHCEECHGPGSDHVAAAERDEANLHFKIESRWTAKAEVQMCGRCHRLPEDVDPDRLKRYPKSLVRFQSIGLLQSPCFLKSEGKLSCTTCHSPHDSVESRTQADQIQTCLNCHQADVPEQIVCPVSPRQDCIRCHMPAIDLVRGIQFHDHWIRVRAEEIEVSPESEQSGHKQVQELFDKLKNETADE